VFNKQIARKSIDSAVVTCETVFIISYTQHKLSAARSNFLTSRNGLVDTHHFKWKVYDIGNTGGQEEINQGDLDIVSLLIPPEERGPILDRLVQHVWAEPQQQERQRLEQIERI